MMAFHDSNSEGAFQSVRRPQDVGWRLGVLVHMETDDCPLLRSNPMQLLRVCERDAPSLPYCVSICRQASLGTFRFSNEYNSIQNVGDNVCSVDSSLLQFPTIVKLTAVDHPRHSLEPVEVNDIHIGLVQRHRPDILMTSLPLIQSLNCFDREPVWYRTSSQPVELERVVIGVDCDRNHQEAQRIVSRLYELSKRAPLIFHQDFDFTVGPDIGFKVQVNVLETSPTLQGTISNRTTIAVLPTPPMAEFQDSFEERPRAQSASNFDLQGPPEKGEYIIEALTTNNFPLQNHFILLPTTTALRYNIQHCQNIWVSPAALSRGGASKRKQTVIPLDVGDDSRLTHMHMAIALLYEDTQQLEKFIPPGQFGRRYLFANQGLAYIHPELLYCLFPETLSPSRTFRISIKLVKEEPPKIMHMKVMEVMRPQSQQLTTDKTIQLTTDELMKPLWKNFASRTWYFSVGDVFSVQTPRGKQFYKVHKMEPSLLDAGQVVANTDWECSVMALRAKTFCVDLVPPNWRLPPPSFFDSTHPPGLEEECNTLFSFFAPAFTGTSSTKPHRSPSILVSGPPGVGKRAVIQAVARRCRMSIVELDCFEFVSEVVVYAEKKLVIDLDNASLHAPVVLMLSNVHMLGKKDLTHQEPRLSVLFENFMHQVNQYNQNSEFSIVVTALTSRPMEIPSRIHALFLQQLVMAPPTMYQREAILSALVKDYNVDIGLDIADLAKETAGFVLGDLVHLACSGYDIAFAALLTYCQSLQEEREKGDGERDGERGRVEERGRDVGRQRGGEGGRRDKELEVGVSDSCSAAHKDGIVITTEHFQKALEQLRSSYSDAIGAPKIPSVSWEDVGGLEEAKKEILDTIQLPLLHPELFPEGLRRSGVLLYGAPGTGKTLLAKAVATECSLNFLSVKGPELINKYVGQSEENVREVFTRARSAAPCVIFFDELDSIAPNRGRSGDSGGVMDRVVSQLLAELDGLDKADDVFVIGATNRPDLLDTALLRPGRFDRLVYLDVSEDASLKEKILRAITRKIKLEDCFDFEELALRCPSHATGADLYALCSNATISAVRREIQLLEDKGLSDEEWSGELIVTMKDFNSALETLTLSVSSGELAKYKELHKSLSKKNSSVSKIQTPDS